MFSPPLMRYTIFGTGSPCGIASSFWWLFLKMTQGDEFILPVSPFSVHLNPSGLHIVIVLHIGTNKYFSPVGNCRDTSIGSGNNLRYSTVAYRVVYILLVIAECVIVGVGVRR